MILPNTTKIIKRYSIFNEIRYIPLYRSSVPSGRSIAVGADDFAGGPGTQGPPRRLVHRLLHEPDAAVAEEDVGPSGMIAPGIVEGRRADVALGAGAPGMLHRAGRHEGVEKRVALR